MEWMKRATEIQGWMQPWELTWLQAMASNMDTVVEIGAWKGRSTVALAAGAKKVICVDTWKGSVNELDSTHKEVLTADIYGEWAKNTEGLNVDPIREDSVKAAGLFNGDDVDMVFIDANHTADAVEEDILAWLPVTKKIICGHDWNRTSVREGVNRVFQAEQVKMGAGDIWWVDLKTPIDNRELISVCIPGANYSRAWLGAWNELFAHLMKKFRVCLHYAESNNIYQVRNITANSILQAMEQPKYVLWIDSDNLVSVQGFEELYASINECPEVSGVGAWYRFFGPRGSLIAAGTGSYLRPTEEQIKSLPGLLEVGYIGFGFLLMRQQVIRDMGFDAFLPIRYDGTWCTDDGGFCDHATKKGHRFFLHPKVFAPHLKLGEVPATSSSPVML